MTRALSVSAPLVVLGVAAAAQQTRGQMAQPPPPAAGGQQPAPDTSAQRRPLQAGTPLQLADGQQLKGLRFQLPRGSVIGGRVLDEDGEAMPGVMVRVMRYQYLQGARRLTPGGGGQTDDKGQYRVWGLMPGDYYVNATARGGPMGPGMFGGFGGPGG